MSTGYDWSRHSQAGEVLLWQGRPTPRFRPFIVDADVLLVPLLSLLFLSMIGLSIAGLFFLNLPDPSSGSETDLLAGAGAVIFMAIGLMYVASGRAVIDMLERRGLRYAVTHRRILSARKRFGPIMCLKITPDLKMDVILGRFTTIRFNHAIQHQFPSASTIEIMTMGNFRLFLAIFVGYLQPGPELRLIADGKTVSRLLKPLRAQSTEATV